MYHKYVKTTIVNCVASPIHVNINVTCYIGVYVYNIYIVHLKKIAKI